MVAKTTISREACFPCSEVDTDEFRLHVEGSGRMWLETLTHHPAGRITVWLSREDLEVLVKELQRALGETPVT